MNIANTLDNLGQLDNASQVVTTDFTVVGGVRLTVAKPNQNRIYLAFDGILNGSVGQWYPVTEKSSSYLNLSVGDFDMFYKEFYLNRSYHLTTCQWDFFTFTAPTKFTVVEVFIGGK